MRIFFGLIASSLCSLLTVGAFCQSATINGNVRNGSTKEEAGAVSVMVKGTAEGTFTDDKGNFKLTVKSLPVTLVFSSIGYETKEVVVQGPTLTQVDLKPSADLGQEIVVSASRVPQKILESPVSIERVSAANLRNSPAANYYDVVTTLKGVDITTSSLIFTTPTTRGFNSSGNTRFNQLVDGMDNQAPGLNFSVGAIVGLTELDVDNMELLSGASSALYGPGGMNGTLLITSKNPFKYQGLSFIIKEGMMQRGQGVSPSPYTNWALRWAHKVSERLAFKINAELVQAKDWMGNDYRDYSRTGTTGGVIAGNRQTDPNYDGINVYGDETSVDLRLLFSNIAAKLPGAANFINANGLLASPQNVSRTGYSEKDLINPNTVNFKLSGSINYKLSENTELIAAAYWGTGNTIYTGSDRYSLKDFKMGQYKIELNNKNWMLRAYTTQEDAGQSFNLTATTRLFNEAWKPSVAFTPSGSAYGWYVDYAYTYLSDRMNGMNNYDAHQAARAFADIGRPTPGTAAFKATYDAIREKPISQGGGLLLDKSSLYAVEGSYNLSSVTKNFLDVLIGANYKTYRLNSQGTLFADSTGPFNVTQYGAFVQLSRKIANFLSLTASGRYDKADNFSGHFTPRITAVVKLAENNNLRFSYQTAYRFPSNQQQWINLQVGSTRLVGSNPHFADYLNLASNPLYDAQSYLAGSPVVVPFPTVKPESVSSFEAGYKSLVLNNKLLIDLYGYWGQYTNFLSRTNTVQVTNGRPITDPLATVRNISVVVNAPDGVKTYGFGFSLDYRLPANFVIGGNISSDNLSNVPANFVAYFNSPKYKGNLNFGNTAFGPRKLLAFNVAYRWQEGFYYQGDFANGNLPAIHTLDAQVSLKLPQTKSIIKLGANNLLNQYYYNGIGNSEIGGLYYISFGYNIY
ncbi:MAG: TonB-dependent receptor [Bacteroidetes bacterium]|nr:TonB-dependent receptor [Bacteroidota bacterium]MBS1973773.1 TonB-dependent receptor [Bacteroidota bacterium]